jgi:uncharacterized protein
VLVKHAVPLGPVSIADAVADAVDRGLADAVVVSGTATGKATAVEDAREAASAAGDAPVYIGSGVTAGNVAGLSPPACGIIVGSWLKIDGEVNNPVDPDRVRMLRSRLHS